MTANPFARLLDGVRNKIAAIIAEDDDFIGIGKSSYDKTDRILAALSAALPADVAGVVEEAGRVLEGVSDGPWLIQRMSNAGPTAVSGVGPCRALEYQGAAWLEISDYDARFIAWCREGVPALISLATAQAAQVAGLHQAVQHANDHADAAIEDMKAADARAEALMNGTGAASQMALDYIARAEAAETALAAERAKVAKLVGAAKALNVRALVSGWNGEGLEKPYTPHPPHLRATIKTTCGVVYALDAALSEAEVRDE